MTFIVVTHDQDEAMTLATRIGVMKDGIIEQIGEPREIYESPDSRFVADFIGTVNLVEGRIDAVAPDMMRIETAELGAVLLPPQTGFTRNQQVWGAVRPERWTISRNKPDTNPNAWHGVVEELGYIGHMSHYRIRLDSGVLIRASQSNRLRDEDPISWDEKVWISVQPAAFRVLTK